MRPNDDFMDQILELDSENQRRISLGETPLLDTLPKLRDLPDLPKPWHYEFWKDIPGASEVPFKLRHIDEKMADDLDQSISLLNSACLTQTQRKNSSIETKTESTEAMRIAFFNKSQIELASSNPFKMSKLISGDCTKIQKRSPSVSEGEDSSWEYYSESEED